MIPNRPRPVVKSAKPSTAATAPRATPMDPNDFLHVACLTDPAQHVEGDDAGNFRRETQAMLDDDGPHVSPRERRNLERLLTKAVQPHPFVPGAEVVVMPDKLWEHWTMWRSSFVILNRKRRKQGA